LRLHLDLCEHANILKADAKLLSDLKQTSEAEKSVNRAFNISVFGIFLFDRDSNIVNVLSFLGHGGEVRFILFSAFNGSHSRVGLQLEACK
jgi:hypothetical protein